MLGQGLVEAPVADVFDAERFQLGGTFALLHGVEIQRRVAECATTACHRPRAASPRPRVEPDRQRGYGDDAVRQGGGHVLAADAVGLSPSCRTGKQAPTSFLSRWRQIFWSRLKDLSNTSPPACRKFGASISCQVVGGR